MLAASVISKGQVGIGDGIVLTVAGGMLGGSESVEVFILSLLLVFIFSCIGLSIKKLSRKSALPFVPFYFAAYGSCIFMKNREKKQYCVNGSYTVGSRPHFPNNSTCSGCNALHDILSP